MINTRGIDHALLNCEMVKSIKHKMQQQHKHESRTGETRNAQTNALLVTHVTAFKSSSRHPGVEIE